MLGPQFHKNDKHTHSILSLKNQRSRSELRAVLRCDGRKPGNSSTFTFIQSAELTNIYLRSDESAFTRTDFKKAHFSSEAIRGKRKPLSWILRQISQILMQNYGERDSLRVQGRYKMEYYEMRMRSTEFR